VLDSMLSIFPTARVTDLATGDWQAVTAFEENCAALVALLASVPHHFQEVHVVGTATKAR